MRFLSGGAESIVIKHPLVVGVTSLAGETNRPQNVPEQPTRTAVELRLDLGAAWHQVINDRAELTERIAWLSADVDETSPPPVIIASCRRKQDGGEFNGDEKQRLQVLQLCGKVCDYVDIESGVQADVPPTKILRSFHDFENVPDFDEVADKLAKEGGAMLKIVGTGNCLADNLKVRDFLDGRLDASAFLMGEYGVPSRILALMWGSRMTYASLGGESLAPGMIDFQRVVNLYRAAMLDQDWEVFGIAGEHVGHSLSPALHNVALKESRQKRVYLPLAAKSVDDFLEFAKGIDLIGASVTVPFKEEVLKRCEKLDEASEKTGAANTLIRLKDGGYRGRNTDVQGFGDDIKVEYGSSLFGRTALVLGAGGAARSVVLALREARVGVKVWARRIEQAEALCKTLGGEPVSDMSELGARVDLLINTTPCGMEGEHDGETALPWDRLRPLMAGDALVYDLVYEPDETPLMKAAEADGFRALNGLGMLRLQGALQAKIFGYKLHFDLIEPPRVPEHLWLVGYRSAGKSALARELAIKVRRRAVDTDAQIALQEGMSISKIFAEQGEEAFRKLEHTAIAKAASAKPDAVIAVGGGAVENEDNIKLMRASGTVIFLEVPEETLIKRLSGDEDRPSLTGKPVADEVHEVLERRVPLYQRAAHIDYKVADKPIRELAGELAQKLAEFGKV